MSRPTPRPKTPAATTAPTASSLVHELHVHQAELETQNEELRRTQLDLATARDRFVDLYDFAPVGYLTLDEAGRIVEANLTGAHMLEAERRSLLGSPFARFVATADASRWHQHLHQALQSEGSMRIELALRRRDGGAFHGQLDCLRVGPFSQRASLRVTLTDISQRKQAELDRGSADKALEAREAERRDVARELHEELGQRLSALKMDLASLGDAMAPSAQAMRIASMIETLDEAVATVRRIATDLRPLMLDDLGLVAAIDWLVRDTAHRTGLEITLHADEVEPPLSERSAIALYRMVQEALVEIAERRQGTDVCIGMHLRLGELVLTIDETGSGWVALDEAEDDLAALAPIRESARVAGGRLELQRTAEGGRRTKFRLPVLPAGTPGHQPGAKPR